MARLVNDNVNESISRVGVCRLYVDTHYPGTRMLAQVFGINIPNSSSEHIVLLQ